MVASAAAGFALPAAALGETAGPELAAQPTMPVVDELTPIDFRYSSATYHPTFCFPDDPNKSLGGEHTMTGRQATSPASIRLVAYWLKTKPAEN